MKPIRILLADDHTVVRKGLRLLLESHPGFQVIAEAANGHTTPDADDVLRRKGAVVIPDILANAGGVTVSYFEWVQDLYSFFWKPDQVREELRHTIRRAYEDVETAARRHDTDLRTGALICAVGRVEEATRIRGIFP